MSTPFGKGIDAKFGKELDREHAHHEEEEQQERGKISDSCE